MPWIAGRIIAFSGCSEKVGIKEYNSIESRYDSLKIKYDSLEKVNKREIMELKDDLIITSMLGLYGIYITIKKSNSYFKREDFKEKYDGLDITKAIEKITIKWDLDIKEEHKEKMRKLIEQM